MSIRSLLTRQVGEEYIHAHWSSSGANCCSGVAHLRQYVDALIAASEGQAEHRAASVGHRRGLQLQHQIGAVGLGQWRLGVLLWTHHMEGLQEGEDRGRSSNS